MKVDIAQTWVSAGVRYYLYDSGKSALEAGFCSAKYRKTRGGGCLGTCKSCQIRCAMGVKHAVITSVDRDDLKDGGSGFGLKQ